MGKTRRYDPDEEADRRQARKHPQPEDPGEARLRAAFEERYGQICPETCGEGGIRIVHDVYPGICGSCGCRIFDRSAVMRLL